MKYTHSFITSYSRKNAKVTTTRSTTIKSARKKFRKALREQGYSIKNLTHALTVSTPEGIQFFFTSN